MATTQVSISKFGSYAPSICGCGSSSGGKGTGGDGGETGGGGTTTQSETIVSDNGFYYQEFSTDVEFSSIYGRLDGIAKGEKGFVVASTTQNLSGQVGSIPITALTAEIGKDDFVGVYDILTGQTKLVKLQEKGTINVTSLQIYSESVIAPKGSLITIPFRTVQQIINRSASLLQSQINTLGTPGAGPLSVGTLAETIPANSSRTEIDLTRLDTKVFNTDTLVFETDNGTKISVIVEGDQPATQGPVTLNVQTFVLPDPAEEGTAVYVATSESLRTLFEQTQTALTLKVSKQTLADTLSSMAVAKTTAAVDGSVNLLPIDSLIGSFSDESLLQLVDLETLDLYEIRLREPESDGTNTLRIESTNLVAVQGSMVLMSSQAQLSQVRIEIGKIKSEVSDQINLKFDIADFTSGFTVGELVSSIPVENLVISLYSDDTITLRGEKDIQGEGPVVYEQNFNVSQEANPGDSSIKVTPTTAEALFQGGLVYVEPRVASASQTITAGRILSQVSNTSSAKLVVGNTSRAYAAGVITSIRSQTFDFDLFAGAEIFIVDEEGETQIFIANGPPFATGGSVNELTLPVQQKTIPNPIAINTAISIAAKTVKSTIDQKNNNVLIAVQNGTGLNYFNVAAPPGGITLQAPHFSSSNYNPTTGIGWRLNFNGDADITGKFRTAQGGIVAEGTELRLGTNVINYDSNFFRITSTKAVRIDSVIGTTIYSDQFVTLNGPNVNAISSGDVRIRAGGGSFNILFNKIPKIENGPTLATLSDVAGTSPTFQNVIINGPLDVNGTSDFNAINVSGNFTFKGNDVFRDSNGFLKAGFF